MITNAKTLKVWQAYSVNDANQVLLNVADLLYKQLAPLYHFI